MIQKPTHKQLETRIKELEERLAKKDLLEGNNHGLSRTLYISVSAYSCPSPKKEDCLFGRL